ncbi:MAG: terminase small subunit [Peptostreptococcaceae bacterium]
MRWRIQKAFADYYIELGNATEAYRQAGYKVTSEKVATVEASNNLAKPSIYSIIGNSYNRRDQLYFKRIKYL